MLKKGDVFTSPFYMEFCIAYEFKPISRRI